MLKRSKEKTFLSKDLPLISTDQDQIKEFSYSSFKLQHMFEIGHGKMSI